MWEFRYYEMIDGARKRQHMTLGTVIQFRPNLLVKLLRLAF